MGCQQDFQRPRASPEGLGTPSVDGGVQGNFHFSGHTMSQHRRGRKRGAKADGWDGNAKLPPWLSHVGEVVANIGSCVTLYNLRQCVMGEEGMSSRHVASTTRDTVASRHSHLTKHNRRRRLMCEQTKQNKIDRTGQGPPEPQWLEAAEHAIEIFMPNEWDRLLKQDTYRKLESDRVIERDNAADGDTSYWMQHIRGTVTMRYWVWLRLGPDMKDGWFEMVPRRSQISPGNLKAMGANRKRNTQLRTRPGYSCAKAKGKEEDKDFAPEKESTNIRQHSDIRSQTRVTSLDHNPATPLRSLCVIVELKEKPKGVGLEE
ncbi:hypothetical protein C8R45DRAFT_932242 [Mycena sanguinolenta]|nr:hypothetical protein C8R45DRAFT_932242 [Mycena sanguinolenta]